jgi:2-amino-4-hydroxy-6-hydroxymethyldihydropteridine diphosphokinase
MAVVFVSVGSNVEREHNIRSAVEALRQRFGPLLLSPIYETAPVGFNGTPFYNLVVAFSTALAPHEVPAALAAIEAAHGRTRQSERFAPRTLDLDLLLYGDAVIAEAELRIPRPEITRYAFVLEPLAAIASDLMHPHTGRTYGELWQAFDRGGSIAKVVDLPLD